jgi:hypothetical protein
VALETRTPADAEGSVPVLIAVSLSLSVYRGVKFRCHYMIRTGF